MAKAAASSVLYILMPKSDAGTVHVEQRISMLGCICISRKWRVVRGYYIYRPGLRLPGQTDHLLGCLLEAVEGVQREPTVRDL